MLTINYLYGNLTNMVKTFIVTGANWTAEVNLGDYESLTTFDLQTEAATRAVEARFGKRSDIQITYHKPIKLTKKQKDQCELQSILIELLTEELIAGCGIGNLLCVIDPDVSKEQQIDNEWYISSRIVLANAGIPKLLDRFNEKYPDKKQKTS
jgi:hypothetical protein